MQGGCVHSSQQHLDNTPCQAINVFLCCRQVQGGCVHSSQQHSETAPCAECAPLLQASGLEQELAGLQLQGSSAVQSASSQQDTTAPGWVEYRYSLSRNLQCRPTIPNRSACSPSCQFNLRLQRHAQLSSHNWFCLNCTGCTSCSQPVCVDLAVSHSCGAFVMASTPGSAAIQTDAQARICTMAICTEKILSSEG